MDRRWQVLLLITRMAWWQLSPLRRNRNATNPLYRAKNAWKEKQRFVTLLHKFDVSIDSIGFEQCCCLLSRVISAVLFCVKILSHVNTSYHSFGKAHLGFLIVGNDQYHSIILSFYPSLYLVFLHVVSYTNTSASFWSRSSIPHDIHDIWCRVPLDFKHLPEMLSHHIWYWSIHSATEAGHIVSHVGPPIPTKWQPLTELPGIKRQTECKYAHVANILELV